MSSVSLQPSHCPPEEEAWDGVCVLHSTVANVIPPHPSFTSTLPPLGAAPCSLSRSWPMSPGYLSRLSVHLPAVFLADQLWFGLLLGAVSSVKTR